LDLSEGNLIEGERQLVLDEDFIESEYRQSQADEVREYQTLLDPDFF
jgi:hypothetical protein